MYIQLYDMAYMGMSERIFSKLVHSAVCFLFQSLTGHTLKLSKDVLRDSIQSLIVSNSLQTLGYFANMRAHLFHFLFWRLSFFFLWAPGAMLLHEYENISENISERSSGTRSRCLLREPRVPESHRETLPTISSRSKGITAAVWFRQQGHARALRLPQLLAVYECRSSVSRASDLDKHHFPFNNCSNMFIITIFTGQPRSGSDPVPSHQVQFQLAMKFVLDFVKQNIWAFNQWDASEKSNVLSSHLCIEN